MKQTLVVKLLPDSSQSVALLATMEYFNAACNAIGEVAYQKELANKIALQKLVYLDIRDRFCLPANMTILAISRVVEAYKLNRSVQPCFSLRGSVVYDKRILSWKGIDRVSILSLSGRLLIPFVYTLYCPSEPNQVKGRAELVYRNNTFYLYVVTNLPTDDLRVECLSNSS